MRKVTEDSVKAFMNNEKFVSGNTCVSVNEDTTVLKLHDNIIAMKTLKDGKIKINNCGYETSSTKERLNGIILMCGSTKTSDIVRKKGQWTWRNTQGKVIEFPYAEYVSIN